MSVLAVQAAIAAPSPVRAELVMPFPDWLPSLPFEREADQLAWVNDDSDNDFASYPGPGWQSDEDDAGPAYEPSEDEQVRYAAGDTIAEADHRERVALYARWDEEARQQAELDWLLFELHSPYTPTFLGDPSVARLALASSVGHPA